MKGIVVVMVNHTSLAHMPTSPLLNDAPDFEAAKGTNS
jgi:hypothetical protein